MKHALILVALCRVASADPKADKAFASGQKAFLSADYARAVELFKEAYAIAPDPVFLFNVAQSYRKLLDCEQASAYYTRYLADATDADKKQRAKVTGWLAELKPCVDQRTREHEEAKRGAEAVARQRAQEEQMRRDAAKPKFADVDGGANRRHAGIALFAVGAAAMGFGLYESIHGASLRDAAATACATSCEWSDQTATDASGHRANKLAAVGWIGGGALALGGVVLYYLGFHRVEHVQINATATGGGVLATFAF